MEVESDLPNYATRADLKKSKGVDISVFAKKVDLASLRSENYKLNTDKLKNVPNDFSSLKSMVDKLDIVKSGTTPVDLSKLSDAVKNDVVKKTKYNKLVKRVNKIKTTDTSQVVKKVDRTQKLVKLKRR